MEGGKDEDCRLALIDLVREQQGGDRSKHAAPSRTPCKRRTHAQHPHSGLMIGSKGVYPFSHGQCSYMFERSHMLGHDIIPIPHSAARCRRGFES